MTDNEILQKFWPHKITILKRKINANLVSDEELTYLQNRYVDCDNIYEALYRIKYNIDVCPKCPICGNKLPYNVRGYNPYCSKSCASKNPELIKHRNETILERYGVTNPAALLSSKEKSKQTCLKKYGTEYYLNSKDCKEKTIKKFGVDNYRKTEECKQKVSQYHKEHADELNEKRKQSSLEKYGVDSPMKLDSVKNKFNHIEIQHKGYLTKKKNHSLNISKTEDNIYEMIKIKYTDIIRQYKSDLYSFCCDFYIPILNLYIEYNGSWTHGGHPYNPINDKLILEEWKNKSLTSDYYKNAIETWTIRDVKKREIAKQNNLNYIEFWNVNEVKKWLNN